MGTTSTALSTQAAVQVGYSLVIEGYDYVLCDAADPNRVVVAYGGTWPRALPGLKIRGSLRESIAPWQADFDVPSLTFEIQPDANDTFGVAVWKSKPTKQTHLGALYQPNADGTGTLTVRDASSWTTAGQSIFVGSKRMEMSAASGTTFTITNSQSFEPFEAEAGPYTRPHAFPDNFDYAVSSPSKVTDLPQTWIGRHVALYCHRVVGGVWDVVGQARLEFAGVIVGLAEGELGATVIQCEDLRKQIRDCTLLKDQWIGYVQPGIRLVAGQAFYAQENVSSASATLTVVSGAPGSTDEVQEGYYSLEEFLSTLNNWLANAAGLNADWHVGLKQMDVGRRLQIGATFATSQQRWLIFGCTDAFPMLFLGYGSDDELTDEFDSRPLWVVRDSGDKAEYAFVSSGAPYRVKPFQGLYEIGHSAAGCSIDLEKTQGEWVDIPSLLPAPFDAIPQAGESWGFIIAGNGHLHFAKKASDTELTGVGAAGGVAGFVSGNDVYVGLTVDDPDDVFTVRQVVILSGSFTTIFSSLLLSTDGRSNNSSDYDIFPLGMSCPGIPETLFSTDFFNSCKAIEQQCRTESMLIVIDKPTKLLDYILPELALRFAWLIWKDGGYRLVTLPSPNPLTAEHTLDETNKAGPAEQPGMLRASARVTEEYLRNVVTVRFNRRPDGTYANEVTCRDPSSVSDYGGTAREAVIELPSACSDQAKAGIAVQHLIGQLLERAMPHFAKPLRLVERTIAPTLFHIAPGDTVSFSDNDVRDPVSGRQGISNRGCICLSKTINFGQEGESLSGSVQLLLVDEDRVYPLAPCASVDYSYTSGTFTSGYSSSTKQLKIRIHDYSRSSDATDDTRWASGDLVRIEEVDPADPTSILAWDRVLASAPDTVNHILTLTATLTSPTFDTAKRYRVVPQLYSAVQASQQLSAFMTGTDDLIEGLALPNAYGADNLLGFTRSIPTTAPRLIPTADYAAGRPLHAGLVHDLILMANHMVSLKSAVSLPWTVDTSFNTTSTSYELLGAYPVPIGGAPYLNARRKLYIRPWLFSQTAGKTASCRITSSRGYPRGSSRTGVTWPPGTYRQVEFTTTSATGAALTEQTLDIVMSDIPGCTWLSIELKTSDVTSIAQLTALSELYVGVVS